MYGNQFAHSACGCGARHRGGFYSGHIASDEGCHIPAPIFSHPMSVTLAAFTIASAASIIATKPLFRRSLMLHPS